jgi:hypothetical protein
MPTGSRPFGSLQSADAASCGDSCDVSGVVVYAFALFPYHLLLGPHQPLTALIYNLFN